MTGALSDADELLGPGALERQLQPFAQLDLGLPAEYLLSE